MQRPAKPVSIGIIETIFEGRCTYGRNAGYQNGFFCGYLFLQRVVDWRLFELRLVFVNPNPNQMHHLNRSLAYNSLAVHYKNNHLKYNLFVYY